MLNTHSAQQLTQDITAALLLISNKYDIQLRMQSVKYSPTTFSCFITGDDENATIRFERFGPMFGLKMEHLNQMIKVHGQPYKIVDIKPGARKNNIIIENLKGKKYVCSADVVLSALGAINTAPVITTEQSQIESKRSEQEIITEIRNTYSSLSPENLTCDGELSRTQVEQRRRKFEAQLKSLFAELGREVDEDEAYAGFAEAFQRDKSSLA